ncbi:hypothetical protein AB0I54_46810 [Streptomyces sp. NPDC050625]|uniref:hypothetical protein n=1 Tax=Streptomyces sp. NPDC050625 TaxID=3154629 RepID=UPI003449418A
MPLIGLGDAVTGATWRVGSECALAIAGSELFAVGHIVRGALQAADTAGLLGLPLGVIGLVTAVMALRRPIEGNDAELARLDQDARPERQGRRRPGTAAAARR